VDQTGEWTKHEPGERPIDPENISYDLDGTLINLARVAEDTDWRLVAYLEPEEVSYLTEEILLPVPRIQEGYAAKVGGMGIYLDEVDVLCPNGQSPSAIRHLWRRGRHAGLSVYSATQRPANVSKEVTSQCRWLVIFKQHEQRDVDYLRGIIGRDLADRALMHAQRVPWGSFLYDTERRRGFFLDKDYRQTGVLDAQETGQMELT
jgi:hypothetical protein